MTDRADDIIKAIQMGYARTDQLNKSIHALNRALNTHSTQMIQQNEMLSLLIDVHRQRLEQEKRP